MNQPQLIEYGLTDENIQTYHKQLKKYNEAIDYVFAKTKEHNKFAFKVSLIPTILLGIVTFIMWWRLNNLTEGSVFVVVLMIIITIAYPIIVMKLLFIEDFALTNFEKKKRRKFEENLTCSTSKYDFVDKALEEKITNYNIDLEKYKNVTDKSRTTFWKLLTHRQFEIEVANLYSLLGYSTIVTKSSGDGGIDVIIKKDEKKIGIQCKHHNKPVGPNDFRALIGVIASQDFDYGIFVSLNGFTPSVFDEARKSKVRIELISCDELVTLAKSIYTRN